MSAFSLIATTAEDADALADLRARAMQPSLEAVGRFDPVRVRTRFLSTFDPSATWHIVHKRETVGVLVLRSAEDHLLLDHLYIEPKSQGQGIGEGVLTQVFAEATKRGLPVRVGALRESRSNAFYMRNGFRLVSSTEWDNYYTWEPSSGAA